MTQFIPLEELEKMSSDEIHDYLVNSKISVDKVTELLCAADIPTKKMSRKKLIEFAANSISGIGLYKRISSLK